MHLRVLQRFAKRLPALPIRANATVGSSDESVQPVCGAEKDRLLEGVSQAQLAAFNRGSASGYALGRTYLIPGQPRTALRYFRAALLRNDFTLKTLSACECVSAVKNDPGYVALFSEIRTRMHLAPISQATFSQEVNGKRYKR